jgi:hypothetical protein
MAEAKILRRCHSTVRGLMYSAAPISGLLSPSVTSRAMRASWLVSSPQLSTERLRTVSPVARSSCRALGEGPQAQCGQRLVSGAQLGTGVDPATLPPQPLAVQELCPGELDVDRRAGEPVDGLPVVLLGGASSVQQGAPACLDPERPLRPARACHRRELLQRTGSRLGVPGPHACLDEFDERPPHRAGFARIRCRDLGRPESFRVAAETVGQHCVGPPHHVHADTGPTGSGAVEAVPHERLRLLGVSSQGEQARLLVAGWSASRRLGDGPSLLHQGGSRSEVTHEQVHDGTGAQRRR